eukprot:CAMPEP_0203662858 /NCGR_PEP_ID=MMETSP0090-20130426/677_1 /ASSEMBLY_ACC=CAM_ASM_001088 /TAXON_ID=426623 /ORGANISM="Chaetoceros affinis, Strain CCMP159" /LENGTH=319 /DNA_ID=CAMNT_0050525697 /DNA_START=44 /DNA_END=1003 /DNA_ORIENTATION=+
MALVFIGRSLICYIGIIPIAAIFGTMQEYKIWKTTPKPLSIVGHIKVYILNVLWCFGTGLAAISLLPMWAQRGFGKSAVSIEQNAVMENLVATGLFRAIVGRVKIVNEENIPHIALHNPKGPAPIFIANHASQIDVCVVYYVAKRFKWIAKESVKYMPGVGIGMILGDHIFIQRKGKNGKSVSNLYEESNKTIQSGIPMMIFPQGTRRITKRLPFKDGAFNIAIENEAPIVPVSIDVSINAWNSLYPLNLLWGGDDGKIEVTMTIHKPIEVKKDTDKAELKTRCQDIIYSVLPAIYHGSESESSKDGNKTNSGSDKKKH